MENSKIQIWTDGASRGNPGPASWACHCPNLQGFQFVGGENLSTNNRMEMTAIIEALKGVMALEKYPDGCDTIEINSDSSYAVNTFCKWIWGWLKEDILNEKKNPDLLRKYVLLRKLLSHDEWTVRINHVKGHSTDLYNIEADALCNHYLNETLQSKSVSISIERLAFWMSKISQVTHAWYHPKCTLIVLETEDDGLWDHYIMKDANLLTDIFPGFNVCTLKSSDIHPIDDGLTHE